MAKEDIIGGLLLAVQKGESLEQAMLSFFNAGYKREEIEMAAREAQALPDYPIQTQKPQFQPKVSLKPAPKLKKLPQTSQVKPLKKLNLIPQNVPKAIKAPTDQKPFEEPSSKEPLSLSQPTPKLNESQALTPEASLQAIEQEQAPFEPRQELPQPILPTPQPIPSQPVQNPLASNYGGNGPNSNSIMIWVLSALLVSLILFLGGVFLFRDSLIVFFNNLA